ncbi:MAG: hypothetical protein LQ342_000805 [Letrouitia transgressa]|nr:MAG: hypothetical protein LQ342_000805 [Letrouitia transgressa]
MSLRIAPPSSHPTSTSNTTNASKSSDTSHGAPSAPGIHDTLRSNLSSGSGSDSTSTSTPTSAHPLEARLAAWQATQDELKMTGLRRTFGIAEPVRRGMELQIAREGEQQRPRALGPSARVSGDILAGRDLEVSWEDVFTGK